MKTRKSIWLAMFLLVAVLLVFGASRTGGPKTQQDRIDSITSVLACPTCSGESVFVSRAAAAESIRAEVARQVAAGLRSDEQIMSYIEQRFGGQVLLVPRATGVDSLVWALPVAALVFSMFLLVSAFVKWRGNKPTSPTSQDEQIVARALNEKNLMSSTSDHLAQLKEQRDFLLNSLRDLESELNHGDIDDQDFESLRKDYVSRAAAVIKQIENLNSESQSANTNLAPEKRNLTRTLVTVSLVVLVAVAAGWFVAQQSGQRLAGDSLAGSIEDSTATILSRARATNFVDPKAAIELYTQVLEVDPDNVEALTYRAWLLVLISRSAGDEVRQLAFASASSDLERAIGLDPNYADAHCFLGIARFRLGNDAMGAKEQLSICSEKNPPAEVKGFVDSIVAEVDAALDK